MATTFKRLAYGNITTASSNVTPYAVPIGYKTIIKSFVISNSSASSVIVYLTIANTSILYLYTVKANDTIIVPVMDQLLIAGNAIVLSASAANSISYYISGIETLVIDPEYTGVIRMGIGAIPVSRATIVTSSSKDRLIKGIIICNTNVTDKVFSIDISGIGIIQAFTVKSYDTILVPTIDILLPATETISASANSTGITYYITGKEL